MRDRTASGIEAFRDGDKTRRIADQRNDHCGAEEHVIDAPGWSAHQNQRECSEDGFMTARRQELKGWALVDRQCSIYSLNQLYLTRRELIDDAVGTMGRPFWRKMKRKWGWSARRVRVTVEVVEP